MARWADFSAGRPTAAELIRAGFVGVICYIGLGSSGKRITRSQYEDYTRSGLKVLLVAELGIDDAWAALDDYATGAMRAQLALAEARALGIPDYVGIACAADAHATSAGQISDAVRYAAGFASVLGQKRSGFYGFVETSRAVHDAGVVGWHWRCGSEPMGADRNWVNFWQRNQAPSVVMVGGVPCDINETIAPMGAQEDDMSWDEKSGVVSPSDSTHEYNMKEMVVGSNKADWENNAMLRRVEAKLDAVQGALTETEADIIAAVRSGGVDAAAFAVLVAPLIHAGATPEQVQAAALEGVRQAFAAAGSQEGPTT